MSSKGATEGLKDRKRQLLTISKGKPSGPILRTASRELKYRDQHSSQNQTYASIWVLKQEIQKVTTFVTDIN